MTDKLREAAQMALDYAKALHEGDSRVYDPHLVSLIEALSAALAQPEELELPKVRLEEFLKLIKGKENFRGIPVMRTEWPTREET